jgi:hypothetical protein
MAIICLLFMVFLAFLEDQIVSFALSFLLYQALPTPNFFFVKVHIILKDLHFLRVIHM